MRSSISPCNGSQWQSFNIEALEENAARDIYLDLCSTGSDDDKLPVLLQALGRMPLAINLVANLAAMTGLGAGQLLEEYQRTGTAMLGQGSDAKHSLDVCIRLSVESPLMRKQPEALKLLATLSMLPVGTTYDGLAKWWARDLLNLIGALRVLAETSLIQRQEANYSILPVIRSYILDPSRFPSDVRSAVITSACHFLKHHDSSPSDSSFKEHTLVLSAEEWNLQTILLATTNPEPILIEALLVLARHQLLTRPRLEVIEHALKLARQMESHQILLGEVLTSYGRILLNLDCYDRAEEQFSLARQIFLSISYNKGAALRSLDLVDVYSFMGGIPFTKQSQLVTEAKSVFERLDDAQGVALSLYYLGIITGQNHSRTESIEFLTRARDMFRELGDQLNHAKCSFFLEQVYYWDKRYDAALIAGTAAVQEYDHLGQYPGDPMLALGQILFMKANYSDAHEILVRTLAICKSYGRPIDIAQTLEMTGRTWAKMDRKAEAIGAYTEAMEYYGATRVGEGELGVTRCRFLTHQVEDSCLVPTLEERLALCGFHRDF